MTATYRLQLHAGFTFADAADQVDYLADLGVRTVYLSPILQAVRGSQHGYDVLDHTRVNEDLGGRDGLEELARVAHQQGLEVLVDIVPNHMAFPKDTRLNAPLWQLLGEGRGARTASWFDVDWAAGDGRLVVPVLGEDPDVALASGDLRVDVLEDEAVLRYHDHVFPLAAGGSDEQLPALLERQHYRLVSWRDSALLNYRRFFDISTLIAVRVELPRVFDATHELLLDLHRTGVVDGFRVDHPDGLADPAAYLRRLSDACRPGTPVYVEKVLQGDERLPDSWRCSGTTGYDGLRAVSLCLADPAALPYLEQAWHAADGETDFDALVEESKRLVAAQVLQPEISWLAREASRVTQGLDEEKVRQALVELLVGGRVYRGYVEAGPDSASNIHLVLRMAGERAVHERPDLVTELGALLPLVERDGELTAFGTRLQQTWGPVMAKGVEDTTLYRYHRLVALNEVGGEPEALGSAGPQVLHEWSQHQQEHWPAGLNALSTHDTKRSEDVRARILAVSTDPASWERCAAVFAAAADELSVDRPTAHLLWQTLVGVGEIADDRLHGYLVKAVREAKRLTSWTDPDPAYESRVLELAVRSRAPGLLRDVVDAAVKENHDVVRTAVLGQKALQLLVPGIPDVYQGCELVDLSLVDPDNRRPVDFAERRSRLSGVRSEQPRDLDDEKLLVTTRLLHLRRDLPEAFDEHAQYRPLSAEADVPVVGFVRGGLVACMVALPRYEGRWLTERIELPDGMWTDVLTGRSFSRDPAMVPCSELFESYPVAVLRRVP